MKLEELVLEIEAELYKNYQYLHEHPEMLADIESKVRDNFAKAFEQSLGEELPSAEDDDE